MCTECIHSGQEDMAFSRKRRPSFLHVAVFRFGTNVLVGGDDLQYEHEPVSR